MASQLVCFGMEKKGKRQHKYDEVSTVLGCAPFSLDANGYVVGNFVRIGERGVVFPTFRAEGIVSGAAPLKSDKESGSKGGLQYTCDFGKLSDAVAAAYAEWTDSLCELMWVAINEVKTYLEGDQEDDCVYYNPKSGIDIDQVDAFIASMSAKYGGKGTRHFKAFVEDVVVKKCASAAAKTGREVKAGSSPHLKIWASLKRFAPPTLIYQMSEDLKTKTPINGDDLDETAAIMKKVFPAPKEGSFVSARAVLRVGPTRVCNSQMGFSIKPVIHEIAIVGTPCDAQSTRAAAARKAIEEEYAEEGITIAARGSARLLVAKTIVEDDDDVPKKKKAKHESDDEEPAPKKKKPAVHVASDDDEPKPKKRRPADDSEDERPKPRKPAVRDEDSEDERPKPRKPAVRDEDSEDERPKPKKKKPVSDDDEPKPKKKKPVSDDEDEPKPKKKKPVSDDDEPRPKSRKSVVREEEPKKKKPVSDDESPRRAAAKPKHRPVDEDSDASSVSSSPPARRSKHVDPK